ncbi:unnamed protein product [Rotaria sp. Silwood1]|nr:unnamed protein product [Rotaria sp. Silwood1]CAF1577900.1 unnamed protein product [Rotaria sp. Silwood1]CAF3629926.1 unnamed protein product [Rotaria sp. Silwood1]CAF3710771.1 unnamed protein product [Rotaria sp. Silwood1]CAF4784279.1 unnamed protein product [Rotaria sp. Silwood1]
MLSLINTFQANSLYNSVLQTEMANVVSYFQNTTNQALLSTNCTAFMTNLKTAKLADKVAAQARDQIASDIRRQFKQAALNATGLKPPSELDSSESKEHRF